MSDRISLGGVRARGFHGVLPEEKVQGQDFVVDVLLDVDLSRAAGTDDLAHTVSYAEVAADVVALVEGPSLDLIETLAGRIADAVLARPLVEAVEVTVHKPQAPVGVPFGDVAVTIRRERCEPVVVALGANLGDVVATLTSAVRGVAGLPGVQVCDVSPLVETDPVGGPDQPVYLNAVLLAQTRLAPWTLLRALHDVEAAHGRVRETRWGARTLDLDLVQYGVPGTPGERTSAEPELELPHPRAADRAFVLEPWRMVQPEARLRVAGDVVAVADRLQQLDREGVRPGPEWRPTW
jgi:dihydroneopterin aldolase / 2-amino-4-hydroxy-6-hydroxymethyldihydropteridine diphosphokinase